MFRQTLFFVSMALALAAPSSAGPSEDAAAAVTSWLDGFNSGDVVACHAGHMPNAVIVDEFPPFMWTGEGTSQRWLDD